MKKSILIALAALALLATGCTKEDPAAWIDNTRWNYHETRYDGYTYNCGLTLRKGGELSISFKNGYYASGNYRYTVSSYKYDGDKTGTITLSTYPGAGAATTGSGSASFTLSYDQKQMNLNTPQGNYTLTRNR